MGRGMRAQPDLPFHTATELEVDVIVFHGSLHVHSRMAVHIALSWCFTSTETICNRVHLHIVFVLLYVLCVSLCRCSFVCVRQSIFYVCVTCCDLHVTIRRHYKGER